MNNSLTTKTWHVVNGAIDLAVDPIDAERIKDAFLEGSQDHYEFRDGTVIPRLGCQIMPPSTYEDFYHRRNGEWKCDEGNWHRKGQKCECPPARKAYVAKVCGKCHGGFLVVETGDRRYPRAARACPDCRPGLQEELEKEHESRMQYDENYRDFHRSQRIRAQNERHEAEAIKTEDFPAAAEEVIMPDKEKVALRAVQTADYREYQAALVALDKAAESMDFAKTGEAEAEVDRLDHIIQARIKLHPWLAGPSEEESEESKAGGQSFGEHAGSI